MLPDLVETRRLLPGLWRDLVPQSLPTPIDLRHLGQELFSVLWPKSRAVAPISKLRVLVVAFSPPGLPLTIEDECEKIISALAPLPQVEVVKLSQLTIDDLRNALLREEINVLHFAGYASYDPRSGEAGLFFAGDDACRISHNSAAVFSEFSVAAEGGMWCGPGFDRWRLNPGLDWGGCGFRMVESATSRPESGSWRSSDAGQRAGS